MRQWISGKRPLLLLFVILCFGSAAAVDAATVAPPGDLALRVESWEKEGLLGAEVVSRLDYPYARFYETLTQPGAWCQILPLVFNIKSCTYMNTDGRQHLTVYIGRKFYETPEDAYKVDYRFQVQEESAERFRILLFAPEGPHGTGDYRIELEARAESDGRTALYMRSSFRPSLRSTLATRAYLATSGRDKVGFSIQGYKNGEPVYVGGTSGIIERNAMRYYLALKAYLDTLQLPQEARFQARLHAWYDMTEEYPRQLYEMDKEDYLSAKKRERMQQLELQESLSDHSRSDREACS